MSTDLQDAVDFINSELNNEGVVSNTDEDSEEVAIKKLTEKGKVKEDLDIERGKEEEQDFVEQDSDIERGNEVSELDSYINKEALRIASTITRKNLVDIITNMLKLSIEGIYVNGGGLADVLNTAEEIVQASGWAIDEMEDSWDEIKDEMESTLLGDGNDNDDETYESKKTTKK